MDTLTIVVVALVVYRVVVIPTVRGTLGIWIDVLDIRERRRRLRASNPRSRSRGPLSGLGK